ncbi:hypothetical protein [Cesiribacter sp. SM1]|uniref:hypothetical protein n=1 Tax=Cesiribacter sp. SM1 TaxID=2861196 RepID=UPI001CD6616B|nr:hypothetical protein [Cesiribacter sp. SM1]
MQDKVPTRHTVASDEVDIREIFAAIGRFFKGVGRSIVTTIIRIRQATKKFAKLIIASILLGAVLGYLSYSTYEAYYASTLTLSSKYYNVEMLESSIEEINQLAGEGNHLILANKLNISPELAKQIRSFEVKSVVSTSDVMEMESILQVVERNTELTEDQQDEIRDRLLASANNYIIIVTVYDLVVLDALEEGITRYLTDNEYVSRRVSIAHERLLSMREKYKRELERLDRLKNLQAETFSKLAETTRAGSNNVILGTGETANDPLNVYRQDLEFYQEALDADSELKLNASVEIVSGFTAYSRPASLSLNGQLLLGALIGMGIAYLIILLIGINQALNHYEARYSARKSPA